MNDHNNEVWAIAVHLAGIYNWLGVLDPLLSEEDQYKKAIEKIEELVARANVQQ